MSGHSKGCRKSPPLGDNEWAGKVNLLFNRFDFSPPPAVSEENEQEYLQGINSSI